MADELQDTREKRSGVIIRAGVEADGVSVERRVRNLSRFGACIDNADDLVAGTMVRVAMGSLTGLTAEVVWAKPLLAGLRFTRAIDLEEARKPRKTAGSGAQAGWMTDIRHAYRRQA